MEPNSNFTFQAADAVAKQILEKHVLGGVALAAWTLTQLQMWGTVQKMKKIHFKLAAGGSDLQVFCG